MSEYGDEDTINSMDVDDYDQTWNYNSDSEIEDGKFETLGYTIYYYDTKVMKCFHFLNNIDPETSKLFVNILNAHDAVISKKIFNRVKDLNESIVAHGKHYQRERIYFVGNWITSVHVFTRSEDKEKYRIIIPLIPGIQEEQIEHTEQGTVVLTTDVPRPTDAAFSSRFFRNATDIYGNEFNFMFTKDDTLPSSGGSTTYESVFINQWDSDSWKTRLANITSDEYSALIREELKTKGYYYDPNWKKKYTFKRDLERLLNKFLCL